MTQPSLADLYASSTVAEAFDLAVAVCRKLGVSTDTWFPGDPLRALLRFGAEYLAGAFEPIAQRYTASCFLGLSREQAEQDAGGYPWLVRLAREVHNYTADEATFATTRMTLTNSGGALYTESDLAAGEVSYQNTLTGKTYTATSGPLDADGNPAPLKPVSAAPENVVYQDVSADEAGSGSAAAAGEIVLLTDIPGVEATNPAAAQAIDAESPASIEQGAREKQAPLSPKGPADAYNAVAKDASLTGTTGITRSRTYPDDTTGKVRVYLAGPSGAITAEDLALGEAAIVKWATPGCTTPLVLSAVNKVVNITCNIWLYDDVGQTADEVRATIQAAQAAHMLARPIGGDVLEGETTGRVYIDGLRKANSGAFDDRYFIKQDIVSPAADLDLTEQEVPVLGVVTVSNVYLVPRTGEAL
jgi:hypothetical protein